MKFTSSLASLLFGGLLLLSSKVNNVYGSTSATCEDAYECEGETIAKTTVNCYGYYGCYGADITATYHENTGAFASYDAAVEATDSYSYGLASSYYAHMKVGVLYAYGYLANIYSEIESKSTTLYIYFYGYYAGYYSDVYCYEDNKCYIYCGNSYGCTGVDFYCYSGATCYYYCDEDSVCPTVYSGLASLVSSAGDLGEIATVYGDLTDEEINDKRDENRAIKDAKVQKEQETGKLDEELYHNIVKLSKQKGEVLNDLPRELFTSIDIPHQHGSMKKSLNGSKYSPLVYASIGALFMAVFGMVLYCTCLKNCIAKSDYEYQPIN